MKNDYLSAGFSLMEVNLAVFVLSIGILSLAVLYPLGLRESLQGQADLKQSMFADYMLNQMVAAASSTNLPWSGWKAWADKYRVPTDGGTIDLKSSVGDFLSDVGLGASYIRAPEWTDAPDSEQYRMYCCLVPGSSDRVMGIMVQSTDQTKTVNKMEQITNNPVYYAEAIFQGDPTK